MASASSAARLYRIACRQAPRLQNFSYSQQQLARSQLISRRTLSTTPLRWEEAKDPKSTEEVSAEPKPTAKEGAEATSSLELPETWDASSADIEGTEGDQMLDFAAKQQGYNTFDEYVSIHLSRGQNAPANVSGERQLEEDIRTIDMGKRPEKQGFWFDEEDPETHTAEHDEFDEDDITEMAHAKLEEVREMREYQRRAVWELPLLSKLAKPFEPPSDKQVLRWRYTTYMGDNHPAEKKVVVQFAPDDLGLSKVQADKLRKLVGARYNPESDIVKMSCESYPHPAQNKRYLSKLVDDLIASAKDPKDTFADIPLDTRHHRIQPKPRFPKEWFMTEERKKVLEEGRQRLMLEEVHAIENGQVVDGKKAIESHLLKKAEEEAEKKKAAELLPVGGRPLKSGSSSWAARR